MKKLVYLIILCSFFSFAKTGGDKNENEYVDVTITLKPNEVKSGGKAQLLVTFKPQKGIHINLDPPIEFEFEKELVINGKVKISKMKKDNYLDTEKPLIQNLSIKKNLSPGTHTIKGKLIYFYCSDAEGWCSRFSQPINLNITIIK